MRIVSGVIPLDHDKISLIIGLGNPGSEYEKTRHNAGKWFIDRLCELYKTSLSFEKKFHGFTGSMTEAGKKIQLLFPTTFMNKSGLSIAMMCQFYQIPHTSILVIHDELDIPAGHIRLKIGGGNGGHNGLKSTTESLGNQPQFIRLRIGIGHPGDRSKVSDYVLSKPGEKDKILIDQSIERGALQMKDIIMGNLNDVMDRLHRENPSL